METITYKCKNCGGALEYDPATDFLVCSHCGQMFLVEEYEEKKYEAPQNEEQVIVKSENKEEAEFSYQPEEDIYDDVNVYTCSSCGAEIIANEVEATKYCLYCGQHTIIFNRVSKEKRPKKIIPFKISREEALEKARTRFKDAAYVDESFENVTTDSVYGVYMPYYAYYANMFVEVTTSFRDDHGKWHDGGLKSAALRHTVLMDMSKRLDDELSMQIGPFEIMDAVPFNPAYLTGFYADNNDVTALFRDDDAKAFMRDMVFSKALNRSTVYEGSYINDSDYKASVTQEAYKLISREYIYCPIYFITLTLAGKKITIVVNGNTGKVVGSVPINKEAVKKKQIKDCIKYSIMGALITAFSFVYLPYISWVYAGIFFYTTRTNANSAKRKYNELSDKMNESGLIDLSRNRE